MARERFLVAPDDEWRIPPYARPMIWVSMGAQAAQVMDDRGRFLLDMPGGSFEDLPLELRWGRPDGQVLVEWLPDDWIEPGIVGWSGEIAIGGFVERLHALTVRGLDLIVAEVEGGPLPATYRMLPDLEDMRAEIFRRDSEPSDSGEPGIYPLIVRADTLLAEYLHHALVSELAVDCWGELGPEAGRWHEVVGLPILLDAVSLLAPRRR